MRARRRTCPPPLLLAALLLLAPALPALAQEPAATLLVTVTDHTSGRPLSGAAVSLPQLERAALTDARGFARLVDIPAGRHRLEVRRLGYAVEHLLVDFGAGARVEAGVALLLAPIELQGVRAVARRGSPRLHDRGFFRRQDFGHGSFLTRLELRDIARTSGRISDALWRLPGIRMVPAGSSGYVVASSRRGCAADIYIDGMRIRGVPKVGSATGVRPGTDRRAAALVTEAGARGGVKVEEEPIPIDHLVSANDVEAVEWYSGPATTPPEFREPPSRGGDPSCGTLVVWTRTGS